MAYVIESIIGAFTQVWKLAIIVIPLMVVLELAKEYGVLKRLMRYTQPLTRLFKIDADSAFPLLVGLSFGLAFGAGVIIQSAQEGNINRRSLVLITLFLACCHAVVEDTLIFVQVGANGWWLLDVRTIVAFIITFIISRIWHPKYESLYKRGRV